MGLRLREIRLGERDELEPMLAENPEVIEQGFQVVAHQLQTDTGPLDLLGVDSDSTLVVVELKNEASDRHLDQGLRYYEWCRLNLAWIANAYGTYGISEKSPPRLVLIAPSFTETVKRIAKYVDVELQLLEYHAIEDEQGGRGLICTEIDYGELGDLPAIPTIAEKLQYTRNEEVRQVCAQALAELHERGVEARPIHGQWITFWYRGKRFMRVSPRREFFVVDVLSPDGEWHGRQRVLSRDQWSVILEGPVSEYLEYLETA